MQEPFFAQVLGDRLHAGGSLSDLHVPFFGEWRARFFCFLVDVAQSTRLALSIVVVGPTFKPYELLDLVDASAQSSLFDHLPSHGLRCGGGKVEKRAETRKSDVIVYLCARKEIVLHDGAVQHGGGARAGAGVGVRGLAVILAWNGGRRESVVGRLCDTGELVRFQGGFEAFDFGGA